MGFRYYHCLHISFFVRALSTCKVKNLLHLFSRSNKRGHDSSAFSCQVLLSSENKISSSKPPLQTNFRNNKKIRRTLRASFSSSISLYIMSSSLVSAELLSSITCFSKSLDFNLMCLSAFDLLSLCACCSSERSMYPLLVFCDQKNRFTLKTSRLLI